VICRCPSIRGTSLSVIDTSSVKNSWPVSERNADRTPRAASTPIGLGSTLGFDETGTKPLSVIGQGSPALFAVTREPAPDGSVVHMRVPRECDERVHVEKRTTHD
jgi:hypothetical protein